MNAAIPLLMVAALAAAVSGCGKGDTDARRASDTAVLGGYGSGPRTGGAAQADVPPPPVPRNVTPHVTMVDGDSALAVWEEQGDVMAARFARGRGWEPPQPLEQIGGRSSSPRIASNGNGVAMAVWQHTVGRIESLRYSRYEAGSGWSQPDVMPGALPRPRQPGKTAGPGVEEAAVQLEVDAHGNARAQWPSGFDDNEIQTSTYVPGEGWARPVDLPLQAGAAPQLPSR